MKCDRKDLIPRVIAIGKRIKDLRSDAGLLVEHASKQIGISEAGWRNWEGGFAVPTWDKLVLLADFFDTTIDFLLGREPYNTGASFERARNRWLDYDCRVLRREDDAVELVLSFEVNVDRIGFCPISDTRFGSVTARGQRSLFFKSKKEFVSFTDKVLSKARDFCIAEALSNVED